MAGRCSARRWRPRPQPLDPTGRSTRCTAIFCSAAIPNHPIVYDVERIRDGGSFTTRRVKAVQHGRAIFSMSASFHKAEDGYEHQSAMPDVPPPEALPSAKDLISGMMAQSAGKYAGLLESRAPDRRAHRRSEPLHQPQAAPCGAGRLAENQRRRCRISRTSIRQYWPTPPISRCSTPHLSPTASCCSTTTSS